MCSRLKKYFDKKKKLNEKSTNKTSTKRNYQYFTITKYIKTTKKSLSRNSLGS